MADVDDVIGGRYRIKAVLGEGGTAKVFLAERHDAKNGKRNAGNNGEPAAAMRYALKEIPMEKAQRAGMLAELRVAEKLFHPALPHVWEAFEEKGNVYIVMDYVEGTALDKILKEQGALPQDQAVEYAMQLCRAITYLHGFHPPIIYRDVKPANVILQKDGRVKLVDFGAIRQKESRKRRDTLPLGTPGYAAPEQYRHHRQSDVRTDVYGLGVTLYHMLTGHDPGEPPYKICRVREWNRGLSTELERIVVKCTRPSPGRRYQSCAALLKALETYREKERKGWRNRIRRLVEKFSFLP